MSTMLIVAGTALWVLGTWRLIRVKSFMVKLHFLGISDTLGSILIMLGCLLKSPSAFMYIGVGMGALVVWGTFLPHVMAKGYMGRGQKSGKD